MVFESKAKVEYLHSGCLPYQGGVSFVGLFCYLCLSRDMLIPTI